MLDHTNVYRKSDTKIYDYSMKFCFELLILKHYQFYLLNAITLKSVIFAVFCGKFAFNW